MTEDATPTYPGAYSNDPSKCDEVLRDLSLINQPAGALEFVNTQEDEMVTLSYKNGSLLRFNKYSTDALNTNDKREVTMGNHFEEIHGKKVEVFHQGVETVHMGDNTTITGDVDKLQSKQQSIKNKLKPLHDMNRLFETKRTKKHNDIDQAPDQVKSGSLAPTPSAEIVTKTIVNKEPIVYTPGVKAPCKHKIPVIEGGVDEYKDITADSGWGEFTGWGTGNSPSSQDGTWDKEASKDQIAKKREEIQESLFDDEKEQGQNKCTDGGTQVNKVAKDMIHVTGLAFNDSESFRRDPVGKLVPYGVKIDPFGNSVYTQYRESPLIEHVSVEKGTGGSHQIVANDEFNVTAGSGGINQKTTGPMEIFAPVITTTAEQITTNSRGEISLAGQRVDISGEIITLRPKKVEREIEDASGSPANLEANGKTKTEAEQQVLIDGNLNVGLNAIIAGGLHVEGELSLHHITAPMEEQITDGCFEWGKQAACTLDPTNEANCDIGEQPKSPVYADILKGCLIGYAHVKSGSSTGIWEVWSECAPNSVMVHDHMHYFKNLPLKLFKDPIDATVTVGGKTETKSLEPHSAVRAVGARNNFATRALAKPISPSVTQETVVEKFKGNVCEPLEISDCNWEEENKNETIPNTEGVRSAKYTDEDIKNMMQELEQKFEEKYKELQDKLNALSVPPEISEPSTETC